MLLGQGCRCREREGCSLFRGAVAGKERGAPWSGVQLQESTERELLKLVLRERGSASLARPLISGSTRCLLCQYPDCTGHPNCGPSVLLSLSHIPPPPPLHNSVQYTKFCSHLLTCFEHPLVMPAELMFTQMDEIHYLSSKINSPNYRSESVHMPLIEILVLPSTLYLSVMWQMHSIYIVIVALIFLYDIWRTQSFSAKCSITPIACYPTAKALHGVCSVFDNSKL